MSLIGWHLCTPLFGPRAVAPIDALPPIVAAVRGRVPVLVDGGFRRGTDVLKALALGATAVLIGRPAVYGLAAGGERGVEKVLRILTAETALAMQLCGVAAAAVVPRGVVLAPGEPLPLAPTPPPRSAQNLGGSGAVYVHRGPADRAPLFAQARL